MNEKEFAVDGLTFTTTLFIRPIQAIRNVITNQPFNDALSTNRALVLCGHAHLLTCCESGEIHLQEYDIWFSVHTVQRTYSTASQSSTVLPTKHIQCSKGYQLTKKTNKFWRYTICARYGTIHTVHVMKNTSKSYRN